MKKYLISVFVTVCLFSQINLHGNAQRPDYEKYGRIAMAVVKTDFPGDPVRDYRYLGRKNLSKSTVEDSFRFKVQEKNQTFNVTVRINHDTKNKKLLHLTVESQKQ
ncbi:DUF3889 domain-containing protein [Neobacillus jeddahensis]|uniref:DUF3889 domain-containing protein n=1 Tax=Neobacillus jeddahensis TaxID=1461580 RepID=UPI00058B4D93|nr:DUF3889 domain-containing protein [Neobacillus jeddahensis]